MKKIQLIAVIIWTVLLTAGCGMPQPKTCGETQMLAHNVYFSLNDTSEQKVSALVHECHIYLKDHPGVVFFAAGRLSEEHDRPVNDRDFDVALHIIFDSVAAQDAYQTAPDHLTFIKRNKTNWKQVRVFDSLVD